MLKREVVSSMNQQRNGCKMPLLTLITIKRRHLLMKGHKIMRQKLQFKHKSGIPKENMNKSSRCKRIRTKIPIGKDSR